MSVAAYHDLHDNSFESFIDADAIDDGTSKTVDGFTHVASMNPSSSAPAALQPPAPPPAQRKNSFETQQQQQQQQHPSLPNTPKLASNFSFGGAGDHMGGMQEPSLHSLSFDWEDLAAHQHHQLPNASQSSAPASIVAQPDFHMADLNFDSAPMAGGHAWPGANAHLNLHGGRRSMDDAAINLHHSTGSLAPGGSGGGVFEAPAMHARSLSLNLHDAAPPASAAAVDDLNAQAPHVPRPHPFVKMEPGEGMALDAMPFAHPHHGPFAFHGPPIHALMGPMPMQNAAAAGSPPQEKKRKVEDAAIPARKDATSGASAGKPPASAKKASRRKSVKPEAPSSESTTTDQNECNSSASKNDQQQSQQSSSSDEPSGDAQEGGDGSPRKPAPKSKKPPPSASQITESGKPFPVIDTSATHSSLFVPPDTSGLTKREARLVKNRAAAFLSRQRKREQFELLEKQCKSICRLTWKMWETLAGPDAEISAIENTVLPILLSDESSDVRDCLEQIVANKGASIAPTEESIANGAHQRQASWPPTENRSSPSGSAKSGGSKREREDDTSAAAETTDGINGDEANTIAQLRAELEATKQREHSLRMALSEERSRSSTASSSPSSYDFHPSIMQPPVGHYTHFGPPPHVHPHHHPLPPGLHPGNPMMCPPGAPFAPHPAPSEQGFREGRSSERGLSLTIAPQLTAADVDVDTPTADRSDKKECISSDAKGGGAVDKDHTSSTSIFSPHTSWMGHHSLVAAAQAAGLPTAARRATSSMALMVLLFGWALFGSGGLPGADAPRMGITRLAPIKGAFASLGQVFDPLASGSAPDLLGLFNRKSEEDDDEDMDSGDGRRAPSSHLSAQDLALTLEHHLASTSTDLDHVADMLPMCSLDDDMPDADVNSKSSAGAKALDSGWLRQSRERVQNGFIILGDGDEEEADAAQAENTETASDAASDASVTEEKQQQTPRKLKLFLRRPASPRSLADDASMADGDGSSPSTAPSPTSSSTDSQDDIFEDAGARTPVSSSSSSTSGSARVPAASSRAGMSSDVDSSFLELEFSLSGKRFVRDERELASLIQRAAQHATIGGQAAVSGP